MHRRHVLAALGAIALPVAAFAHHGWSSYDTEKVIRLVGPFTSVSWTNPHGTATMNWQGKKWDVVLAPISRMESRGLTRDMIEPGKRVRIVGYPRKDGTTEMRLERVIVGEKTVELR